MLAGVTAWDAGGALETQSAAAREGYSQLGALLPLRIPARADARAAISPLGGRL